VIFGEAGVVLVGHAEVVPKDMTLLDVQSDVVEIICLKAVEWVQANPSEDFAAALDILEGVAYRFLPGEILNLRRQVRTHNMRVHGLQGRLEGGEHIFMGVAHDAVGDLSPALRVEIVGQCYLLMDKLDLTVEVQRNVW